MWNTSESKSRLAYCVGFVLLLLLTSTSSAARKERLALRYLPVELPGAPSAILAADLNRDGQQDLTVVVAYTEWDQIGIEESAAIDGIDGLVEVLTIVPSLIDRRELRVFLAAGDSYRPLPSIELDRSILSLEIGPPELPILALSDDGIAALRLHDDLPVFEPLLQDRPVLARSGTFMPGLGLGHDLNDDGTRDLLFPTVSGAAIYLARGGMLATEPAARLVWPTDDERAGRLSSHYPLPRVRDIDGDGHSDLLLLDNDGGWGRFHVLRGTGDGRFASAVTLGDEDDEDSEDSDRGDSDSGDSDSGDSEDSDSDSEDSDSEDSDGELVYFGDLDGDGMAEWVLQEELADHDGGMREEMREAKQPPYRYRLYRSEPGLAMASEPYRTFEATGYSFDTSDDSDIRLPGGFQDLDGDGRSDLITLTLDFSIMQAVKVLTTRRISIGLDFHVWCQDSDGQFRQVSGLDLSGKFRLDLDDLRVGQMSQFAGDFDADGKADFVQMGRGRDVTIHRGREGCVYPPAPDLKIRLKEEPKDLQLVRVDDFDGDGLTDLIVIQPQKITEPGVTPPVRLDMYLSGNGSTGGDE